MSIIEGASESDLKSFFLKNQGNMEIIGLRLFPKYMDGLQQVLYRNKGKNKEYFFVVWNKETLVSCFSIPASEIESFKSLWEDDSLPMLGNSGESISSTFSMACGILERGSQMDLNDEERRKLSLIINNWELWIKEPSMESKDEILGLRIVGDECTLQQLVDSKRGDGSCKFNTRNNKGAETSMLVPSGKVEELINKWKNNELSRDGSRTVSISPTIDISALDCWDKLDDDTRVEVEQLLSREMTDASVWIKEPSDYQKYDSTRYGGK